MSAACVRRWAAGRGNRADQALPVCQAELLDSRLGGGPELGMKDQAGMLPHLVELDLRRPLLSDGQFAWILADERRGIDRVVGDAVGVAFDERLQVARVVRGDPSGNANAR